MNVHVQYMYLFSTICTHRSDTPAFDLQYHEWCIVSLQYTIYIPVHLCKKHNEDAYKRNRDRAYICDNIEGLLITIFMQNTFLSVYDI